MGLCEACLTECHSGHETSEAPDSPSAFYCDCGAKPELKCKCNGEDGD